MLRLRPFFERRGSLSNMPDCSTTGETGFASNEPLPGVGSCIPTITKDAEFHEIGLTARLRRVTSSGRFIPEIDGLRFIAIMSVILFHLSGQMVVKIKDNFSPSIDVDPFVKILSTGHFGVQLFFVLSGFILALPFASYHLQNGKPVSLRAYYLRRLTRLEPPYLLSLFLFFLLIVVVKLKGQVLELFPHLLASVFYLHNLIYADGSVINYVVWSLEVEVQFYFLAPVIALIFKVQPPLLRRILLLSLIIIFLATQEFWLNETKRIYLSILGQGQFFLTGFLLADFYLTEWHKADVGLKWRWDILSFIGWPLLFVSLQYSNLAHWFLPFAIFFLYTAAFRGYWCRRLLSWPLLTVIGGMCYSIYLLHYQIIAAVWRVTSRFRIGDNFIPNFMLQLGLMLPAIIGVSAIFYLLVEKPCMNRDWPSRLSKKLPFASRKSG